MDHSVPLISTIAVGMGLALVMGFFAVRLKLPAIVGYLMAGIIIGPFTPGFIADAQIAQQLADIGVILLMFGVGLHFSLDDLLEVRKIALPGALVQIAVATTLGACVALAWGWGYSSALVFGLSLSVASTVVLIRALEEREVVETVNGQIAVGWLIVEDLFMVVVLVLLPALSHGLSSTKNGDNIWVTLVFTLIQISTFVAFMLFIGRRFFPRLLWHIARTGLRELFTLCVVAVALGIAYAAAQLFGVSFALGAFFAGMVIRESRYSQRAAEESLPLRDAFAVLFFVAVGMLFDPNVLIKQPLQVLSVVSIIVLGKSLAAFVLVLAFRYPLSSACVISASLAQIGEFSFILAELGVRLNLLPIEGRSFILAGALISIAINPLLFKLINPIQYWSQKIKFLRWLFNPTNDTLAELPVATNEKYLAGQVVLVGYGRVGKKIAKILESNDIPYVIVEENRELIGRLRSKGIPAVYGDSTSASTLIQAHIARASMLIVAVSAAFHVRPIIQCARALNPNIEILIRTHDEDEAKLLADEGPGKVFFAEEEIARSICSYALSRFGKTE